MNHLYESNRASRSYNLNNSQYEYLMNMIDSDMEDNEIASQLGINEEFVQRAKRESIID